METVKRPILEIKNLTKIYSGGKKAVDGLTLTVMRGDIFGFIGQNGAGKTTTLRSTAGILDFDGGEIILDGCSVKADPIAVKSKIAYIPDNPDIYEHLTGIQYLNFVADIFGIGSKERSERIERLAAEFEITGALGDLVGSYSHGMRQKVTLISAFIHSPELLLLDEPFVGLDPKAALTLKNHMRELCENGGAVFFSTHVLDVAEKLCNRIAIIKDGRLVTEGDTEALLSGESLEALFMEVAGK